MSRPAHQSVTDVWTNATAQESSAVLAWHQARQGVAEKAALSFRRTCAPRRMVPFGRTLKENNSWRGPVMGWSGRAPAPLASEPCQGRQSQGAHYVSATQHDDHRDWHRYR